MAKPLPWLVPAVWTGGLLPIPVLALQWNADALGANPISTVLNRFGFLTLIALVASLSCTPLNTVTKWTWPVRIRKHLGLLGFSYATLHLLTYVGIDQQFQFGVLFDDVIKRPFITVGFSAWVLLIPLALTSTAAAVKRLGFVKWKRLHRLAYAIGLLGCIHFMWREKTVSTQSLRYFGVFLALMLIRLPFVTALFKKRPAPRT